MADVTAMNLPLRFLRSVRHVVATDASDLVKITLNNLRCDEDVHAAGCREQYDIIFFLHVI